MSLETVVEDIREEARARADEIQKETDEQVEEIIGEAEADAEEIRRERQAEVERQIEQERERRLSSATLEAKQERLKARREVLSTVRDQVETALTDLEADRREELTRVLLEDALEEFEETAEVYCRPADSDLVQSLLEDEDATLAGEEDCLGGVVVESGGSRIRVNNTFDSVLEDVWEEEIRTISERLFDESEQ